MFYRGFMSFQEMGILQKLGFFWQVSDKSNFGIKARQSEGWNPCHVGSKISAHLAYRLNLFALCSNENEFSTRKKRTKYQSHD